MCLAIPGQVVEVVDEENRLATVEVTGVRRTVNIGLLDVDGKAAAPGDWVLIHVGFALSQIDEGERDRMTECVAVHGCITCGDEAVPMRVVEVDCERSLALCSNREGGRSSVEIALVDPVVCGEVLLVHAGTALGRAGERDDSA
jgi:hydrogenase expression/formation protein HypC